MRPPPRPVLSPHLPYAIHPPSSGLFRSVCTSLPSSFSSHSLPNSSSRKLDHDFLSSPTHPYANLSSDPGDLKSLRVLSFHGELRINRPSSDYRGDNRHVIHVITAESLNSCPGTSRRTALAPLNRRAMRREREPQTWSRSSSSFLLPVYSVAGVGFPVRAFSRAAALLLLLLLLLLGADEVPRAGLTD